MKKRRSLACRSLAVVTYLILVSLTVRWMLVKYCSDEDQRLVVPTPEPIPVPPNRYVVTETESWVLAVRIDWHNYGLEGNSSLRSGVRSRVNSEVPSFPSDSHCLKRFPYNHCVSGTVPVNRHITDTRPKICLNMKYLRELPRVSLVVIFSSQHVTVVLRALNSLRHRTPGILVAETILVHLPSQPQSDDNLTNVEESVRSRFPEVICLRSEPNNGLRGARMAGVRNAHGDVIVFFQMPFEVNVNWLPPLLEPIVEDHDAVTCPLIDIIDVNTFEYKTAKILHGERRGFNWRLQPVNFARISTDKKALELPYTSPLLEEHVFAIRKSRYLEIEDSSLSPQWRGSHIELSLKTWLCGGKILSVPCSRIGMIRKPQAKTTPFREAQNYRIIAHQWFDGYAKFVLFEIGSVIAELTEVKARGLLQKERLICKPIGWFLEKVMPELLEQFPPYIPATELGVIQSDLCRKCVSVKNMHEQSSTASLRFCLNPKSALNYHIHLMSDSHILVNDEKQCLSLTRYGGVVYSRCSSNNRGQLWTYNNISKILMHKETERCFQATVGCDGVFFPNCNNIRQTTNVKRRWVIANDQSQLKPAINTSTTSPKKQSRFYPA